MDKLEVLILGDGLLGSELVKQTGWDYVSRKKGNFDIEDLENSIPIHYGVIINCIANTSTYSADRDTHWKVNYEFVDRLIDYCNINLIKLVHISTDYVYSGSIPNATEMDVPVHCNTWYGYTKLLSDGLIQLRSRNFLIIRCTHKPYPFPYESAWIDQVGNFDYVDVIASRIIELVLKDINGLYNVGTPTKTMFELAQQTNNKVKSINAPKYVPYNTSMDLTKMEKILND